VQERFKKFNQEIYSIFSEFLEKLIYQFKLMLPADKLNRNPIHYASISTFAPCHKTARYLLDFDIEMPGYQKFEELFSELQYLEL